MGHICVYLLCIKHTGKTTGTKHFMGQIQSNLPTGNVPAIPKELFGYEVLERLGEGAASTIYAVTQPATSQVYALKYVMRTDEKSVRFIEQVENEFAVGRQIRHANLRGVIDFHQHRTLMLRVTEVALVLELFDGAPLDVRLPRKTSDILHCFIQTAKAIGAMHHAGFVHCDLKPANILANTNLETKVIDLGQACAIGTAKQRIQGTPDYIAPEQVKCKPVTPQTDIYNFGASLYWSLAAKKLPTLFNLQKGENSFLVDSFIPSPRDLNPMIPENLSNFVMECVRVNPQKRPESMETVISRLEVLQHSVKKSEDSRNISVA